MAQQDKLAQIYSALEEKGYAPVQQIIGFLVSGDPTYITAHKGARALAGTLDTEAVLHDMVEHYFSSTEGP